MLNPADADFLDHLAALLPPDSLRPVEPRYLTEPRGRWAGIGGAVALPRSTDQVARIVAACNAARVGLVPWGGGTGLVGGQVMPKGQLPLILSLERMVALRAFYPLEKVLVVEAGMILADVQAAAQDLVFPLSLASEGSARIGGNLATNAGGVNVLRYGNARDLCLGIEAVLPDGSIFHGLKRLRKDNTGYDLRHLLIGSEGSLGVITAAALRLFARPNSVGTALLQLRDPAAALALLARAEAMFAGSITAFELIGQMGLTFLAETMPEVAVPLTAPWLVLIELGLSQGSASEALVALSETAGDLVMDGVIAQSESQRDGLWRIRESIPEANRRIGAISSHDISLPLSLVPDFIAQAGAELAAVGDYRINCFGHLGDGNLHYNVFPVLGRSRKDYEDQRDKIKALVHDLVDSMGGSVSAEHGLGRLKLDDLERYGDPAKLAAMRAIKRALDPNGIMNPGAVLRA